MVFLTVLAWICGVMSTLFSIIRIIGWLGYSDIDELRDKMRGFRRTYSIKISGAVAIVCWSWIISTYM